jgi:hypothetical protein
MLLVFSGFALLVGIALADSSEESQMFRFEEAVGDTFVLPAVSFVAFCCDALLFGGETALRYLAGFFVELVLGLPVWVFVFAAVDFYPE